jgi:hypothetical protein
VGKIGGGLSVIKSTTAKDPSITPVSFDSATTVFLDGQLTTGGLVNPQGLLGQAWVDVDISGGSGHGNVYVLASVYRDSNNDPGDVMFARSTDGGATFEAPIRINTDSGTSAIQWFGTMSVAPNRRIDAIWLDTRDAPSGTNLSRLYYSYSEDHGSTWSANEPISIAFDPNIGYPQQNKMGDYFDMVSDNEGAHVAWANTINGGQDVYYTRITPPPLGFNDFTSENISEFKTFPNPFRDTTTIEFFSKNDTQVTVEVFDLLGNRINTLLEEHVSGKKSIVWNGTTRNGTKLQSGIYFLRLKSSEGIRISKVIME